MSRAKASEPQPVLMGWCSTGHHDRCRVAYQTVQGVQRTCECSCHAS